MYNTVLQTQHNLNRKGDESEKYCYYLNETNYSVTCIYLWIEKKLLYCFCKPIKTYIKFVKTISVKNKLCFFD